MKIYLWSGFRPILGQGSRGEYLGDLLIMVLGGFSRYVVLSIGPYDMSAATCRYDGPSSDKSRQSLFGGRLSD